MVAFLGGIMRSLRADHIRRVRRGMKRDDPLWLGGLTAEQIRAHFRISRTDYDSARKRMRRCLLREGLTCGKI